MIYGNTFLNENTILLEYSKKELQDPKTIEKIYKDSIGDKVFKSLSSLIMALSVILAIAIGVVTLGLGLFVLAPLIMKLDEALDSYIPKKHDKNFDKLKRQCEELKTKSQERLKTEQDSKEKQALQDIIKNCDNVLKVINDKIKLENDKKYQENLDSAIKDYNNMIKFITTGDGLFNKDINDNYYNRDYFANLCKMFNLSSNDIIKCIDKGVKNNIYHVEEISNFVEYSGLEQDLIQKCIDKGFTELKDKKSSIIILATHDEWFLLYSPKLHKFIDFDVINGVNNITNDYYSLSNYENGADTSKFIKDADKYLGYYHFSKAPENVEPKEFPKI